MGERGGPVLLIINFLCLKPRKEPEMKNNNTLLTPAAATKGKFSKYKQQW